MTKILPETDGWDDAANEHPKVVWSKRIFIGLGIFFFLIIFCASLYIIPVKITQTFPSGAKHVYFVNRYDYWFDIESESVCMCDEGRRMKRMKRERIYDSSGNIMIQTHNWIRTQEVEINNLHQASIQQLIEFITADCFEFQMIVFDEITRRPPTESVPALLCVLNGENSHVRDYVIRALGEMGSEEAVPALINVLMNDYVSDNKAAIALGKIGSEKAIPALLEKLKNTDYGRKEIVIALGKIRSVQSVSALIEIMENEDETEDIRSESIKALGNIETDSSTASLVKMDKKNNSIQLTIDILVSLHKHNIRDGLPDLLKMLQSSDLSLDTSDLVIGAICEIGDEKTSQELIKLLTHEDSCVRYASVTALNQLSSETAVPALKTVALNDPDERVREEAEIAIQSINEKKLRVKK
ncbi:MAG: HEAT repeat domain-containing protein [Planctomycetota bacterium]